MPDARLPTIRQLVAALAMRPGVEAVVLLGRDGLVIEGRAGPDLDLDQLAAHLPLLVSAADDLGAQGRRGRLISAVLECERGLLLAFSLSTDALLLLALGEGASPGPLLFDLRRHREQIAALV